MAEKVPEEKRIGAIKKIETGMDKMLDNVNDEVLFDDKFKKVVDSYVTTMKGKLNVKPVLGSKDIMGLNGEIETYKFYVTDHFVKCFIGTSS